MHQRRAATAHEPGGEAQLRPRVEVVEVLRDGEPGAHGEACDGGIHHEAQPVRSDECVDDGRLEELLDHRRDVAAQDIELDAEPFHCAHVEEIAHTHQRETCANQQAHEAQRDELVAVEVEQHAQKR